MADLSGKVALVTGAGSGIGFDLAAELARQGARVVLGDVAGAERAAARIGAEAALGVQMDVTDAGQVAAAVEAARSRFGGLDIVVNNAGLFTNITRASFADLPLDEWERVFAVNVTGVLHIVRAAWPLLKRSGAGRVINITSATVFSAPPMMLHYVATKGALTAMTRSMAREMGADGITVNAVAPGYTLSEGVLARSAGAEDPQQERARNARAIKRDQVPGDLTGAVAFLAGDAAGFITGQTLVVDGGAVMH
ncbi:SDR family NAD(P)-dependent oxidoreductase [Sinisalibacter aestuarii]|uniref:Short-chain dehydrogenase n=1 Tax=Sinisalibacter aestuarii TaxID=2949426 RepID=A0ABQ5LYB8_9RHOB|nr:glucose 1-dehydrogenase [Sinisalibacter aestuarii]GKY89952.1 short-chain dehydrogenase [Sinisalibacter aestuarii]